MFCDCEKNPSNFHPQRDDVTLEYQCLYVCLAGFLSVWLSVCIFNLQYNTIQYNLFLIGFVMYNEKPYLLLE
jgi:hypothetical protein